MHELLTFIDAVALPEKAAFLMLCISLALTLEQTIKAQDYPKPFNRGKHIGKNLIFLGFSFLINSLFAGLFILASQTSIDQGLGLYAHLSLSTYSIISVLLSLIVLDFFAQYLCHVALHKIPFLWKLHVVHHNDFHIDFSSGSRHHPIDYCTRELAALSVVFLMAMPISHYLLYKLITIFFTYFTHANAKLPTPLHRLISLVFVTPNFHHVHHHQYLPYTDSNYGNVLSIWDKLFRTHRHLEADEIEFGVDTDLSDQESQVGFQLKRPFLPKFLK